MDAVNGVVPKADASAAPASSSEAAIAIVKKLDVTLGLRLREQGLEPAGNSPEEFALAMHADIEKWKRGTREAGIKPQ